MKLNTGYEIPLVGFGTYKVVGQETVDKTVDAALECGYRFFDTAKYYKNEVELGNALEKFLPKYNLKRSDIFLTTKWFPAQQDNTNDVPRKLDESLSALKTDYMDLVLIHYPKPDDNANEDPANEIARKEHWLALEKIFKEGKKVRSIGVSNYEVRHVEEIEKYSDVVPAVIQEEYHPHFRREELKKYCAEKGIFFQAFSSLGRHHQDLIGDRLVVELAEKYNTTVQLLLLAYATSQGVGIVPKSENPERIKENFTCLQIQLSKEDIDRLNSVPKDQHYIRTTGWLVK